MSNDCKNNGGTLLLIVMYVCYVNNKRGVLSVLCPNSSPYYALILLRTMP